MFIFSYTISDAKATAFQIDSIFMQLKTALKHHFGDRLLDDENQAYTHGIAWFATIQMAIQQSIKWAEELEQNEQFTPINQALFQVIMAEYTTEFLYGIPMNQQEFVRLHDYHFLPLAWHDIYNDKNLQKSVQARSPELFAHCADLILQEKNKGSLTFGTAFLDDTLSMIRDQFFEFSQQKVVPFAHGWHTDDVLIPDELLQEMSDLGVFGLTIPEIYGGSEMGKMAMCIVSEELSRGYIGVGSLGTRSEIAAELILCGGTEDQKQHYLPKIVSGEILPTAVFTEPNTGSDLGSLSTKATKTDDSYSITGNKTWITHAARANLMTVLARTNADTKDWKGLSMFLIDKEKGTEQSDFSLPGLQGTEIPVLGYRGMKEYELRFDNVTVPQSQLLGTDEGQGFKQLMQTFESARIQTAARAIGVAQNALDLGLNYALDRVQFGKKLYDFPRVFNKIVLGCAELLAVRQLTYFAARQKDEGKRCDIEAGMAKLLAGRIAWSCADSALQIHGGNGFALEYQISRVLCDARILNIFEGASEIQAHVIAKRILS